MSTASEYVERQSLNPLIAWLHGLRYRNLVRAVASANLVPLRVLDIGPGPCTAFRVLDQKFAIDYTGLELSQQFVDLSEALYGDRKNFRIIQGSAGVTDSLSALGEFDVIMALETLEHMREYDVVRLVEKIRAMQPKLFLCSVPIEIGPPIWVKNIASAMTGYIRHSEYTWSETFWAGFYQLDRLRPHVDGHRGFDWRWLAQTIRYNFEICEMRMQPVSFAPGFASFSAFMVCKPRKVVGYTIPGVLE